MSCLASTHHALPLLPLPLTRAARLVAIGWRFPSVAAVPIA